MIFNQEYFQEITDGDTYLQQELLTRFQSTLASCSRRLERDISCWSATLHELRGSAMAMGAQELADHCQAGEHQTLENQQEYLARLHQIAGNTVETIRRSLAA